MGTEGRVNQSHCPHFFYLHYPANNTEVYVENSFNSILPVSLQWKKLGAGKQLNTASLYEIKQIRLPRNQSAGTNFLRSYPRKKKKHPLDKQQQQLRADRYVISWSSSAYF